MVHCITVSPFFSCRYIDTARYPTRSWLERVVILGLPPGVTRAQVESKSKYVHMSFIGICYGTLGPGTYKKGLRGTQPNMWISWLVEFILHYYMNYHCMGSKNYSDIRRMVSGNSLSMCQFCPKIF